MKKRGNISLEGYRKNSPDRFNDFNIIPSQHIDMNNVNHDVLMIPMGGRGTGNPILAKPGERYFFPNHDFVFEQGMPENATMRYQRIAKFGGNLPKAQMYNSQVGVIPTLDNQFIYPSNFKYEEGTPVQNRAQGCQGPNCLEGANTYYNRYVAPKFGLPNTWKMNEAYGIVSGDPNQPYGVSADSWDLAALMQGKGAIQNYAAPLYNNNVRNTEKEAQAYWNMTTPEEKKKLYSQLALGSLVNFGDYGGLHGERLKGSNQKAGLYPSRHSTRVVGYTEEGIPMIYDMGQIRRIDDPKYDFPLTNITTPKELAKYNYDYVKEWQNKNQKKLDYNPKEKLLLGKKSIREDEDPFTEEENQYVEGINKNIKNLMQATGASQDDIIKAGKVAFGILEAETRGGRGSAKAKIKELAKTVTPFTSEASKGLTRIKPEMQAGDETNKYSQYMKTLGLNPKDLDLWDPEQAALATTALILSRKGDIEGVDKWYLRAQQHNTPGVGPKNEQRLKDADKDYANNVIRNASRIYSSKTGYGLPETEKWMNTKKAEKEKQEGEKIWSERFRPNIMRTESTGYIPNIPSMTQRAYGGDLPKAQDGRIQAATTYASGKEQNYMSPERRAYEQSLANQLAEKQVDNARSALDAAGIAFYPAAVAGSLLDAIEGNYGEAALGLIPGLGKAGKHGKFWGKAYTKAVQSGLPHKVAYPAKHLLKGLSAGTAAGAQGYDAYLDNPYGVFQKAYGGGLLNKTLTCPKCGWSWKAVDGGTDIATCHKCGGTAKMQKGGRTPIYVNDPNDPRLQAYNDSLSWYNHGIAGMKRIMDGTWAPGIPANPNPPFIGANEFHKQFAYLRPEDRFYPGQPRPIGYFTTGNMISPDKFGVMSENNGSRWGDQAYYKKPTQPIVYKESTKVTAPQTVNRRLMTGKDWQDVNSNDYGAEEAKIRSADPNKYDIYRLPNNKFELVPKTKKPSQTLKKPSVKPVYQEPVKADYLPMIETNMPDMTSREPEIIIPPTPRLSNTNNRIAWRMDPETRKMVPVYLEGKTQKVKEGKRLYNKNIPSSTAAIPADFIPQFEPDGNADVVSKQMGGWLDAYDEEYRRGGALPNRRETNKNIKSSINQLMRRNETLFGPRGRNFYNPNPMKKYYKGGIAFPQAPTAGDTPGQQESEFYAPNWIPKGPVGFYEHGGIAYPQQPTSDYFFSGSPWMAHYDMGGGLPSGANNMYMPCMNCGGYMEDGGMYYAEPGKIINPTPVPAMNADLYEKNVLAPKDQAYTQDRINKAKKQQEWDKAHPWTRSAGTTPEGAQLFHKTGQSGTPQDYVYNTKSGAYDLYNPTPVIAKQRYGGFQSGGFMSPDNMMDYPTFSQGGDPYDYADGGINNPGFRALPQNVQQNIISNMADGGNVADYDQDQYTRILGNNFMSGVQGNMPNNTMSEAGMQFAQNPYQMPEGEYGYNMNTPNMMNAGNMFDMQGKYDQLKNKNKGIGANLYNTGMFALGTANQYTKYKARKKGSGNTMDQSAQSGMARYGAAYIPKAEDGRRHLDYFTKAAGMPELTFPSPSSASTSSANPNNLSPEALAKKQAFRNDADAYDQKSAMYNQMQQAGYPNMMRQQGQFAPGFQSMYDNFGNDDYNVGRMSRGMQNMLPYLMANPQNTYLQEYNAKKALFGPGARKVSMKFRTVFDPRTGQQVQVPAEGKGSAKGKADMMNDPNISRYSKEDLKLMYGTSDEPKGTSTEKDYEDMNMFERMKSNRQTKRMMKEEGRREKKWGVQRGIPENPDYTAPAGTTFANNMAYAPAPAPAQSGYPTTSGYNLFNTSLNTTRPAYTPRDVFGTPSSNMLTGPFDQNKRMMERLNQSQALRDPLSVQQQRYGGMYEVGGIQELTEDEIQQIMEAGGSVTYLD